MPPLAWDWFEEKLEGEVDESSHDEVCDVLITLDIDKEQNHVWGKDTDVEERLKKAIVLFKLAQLTLAYQHDQLKRSQRKRSIKKRGSKSRKYSTTSSEEDEHDGKNLERLKEELEEKEHELRVEQKANKKLKVQVDALKKDKLDLQRDLNQFHKKHTTDEEPPWQQRQAEERIQDVMQQLEEQKLHTKQLLDDCQSLEEENSTYQICLKGLEEKLAAEAKHLEELTEEYSILKRTSNMSDEMLQTLRQENTVLKGRLDEVQQLRMQHEQDLEKIAQAVDLSLEKCKEMIVSKDLEIGDLRSRLVVLDGQGIYTELDTEKETVIKLQQVLKDREEQLDHLSRQLKDATDEMESSAATIQELRSLLANMENDGGRNIILSQRHQLVETETTVADLRTKLAAMDEEMGDREKELNEALHRMRQYEAGDYGLAEAMAELRDAKKQFSIVESQGEQLTQQCNILEMDMSELQTENEELRTKLGLSPSHKLSSESTSKLSSLRIKNQKLSSEMKKLKEDLLNYRLENQSLKRELRKATRTPSPEVSHKLPSQHSVSTQITLEAEKKERVIIPEKLFQDFEKVCAENLVLRKGLAEILDAVREHDGSSDVKLESPTLEKLLTVLNAERNWGHYDPSLDLQCQLEKLQGQNSLLRENLRELRRERKELKTQLKNVISANAFQQKVLTERATSPKSESEILVTAEATDNQKLGICQLDLIDSTLRSQETKARDLELEVSSVKAQLGSVVDKIESQRAKFMAEREALERNLAYKVGQVKELERKSQELEFQLRQARNNADETEQLLLQYQYQAELPPTAPRSFNSSDSIETSQAKQLLQKAIVVLRSRLQEKELVVDRFQSLLEESRREQCQQIEDHKSELIRLQDTIYSQQKALSRTEKMHRSLAAAEAANRAAMSQLELQSSQAAILEEEIQILQQEKEAWQIQSQEWQHKCQQQSREMKQTKDSVDKEPDIACQKLKKELQTAHDEIQMLRKGYDHVTQDLTAERFEQQRAKLLNVLVHKLKVELTSKEQQMKSLQTIVEQLKKDFDSRNAESPIPVIHNDEIANLQTKNYDLEKKCVNLQAKLGEMDELVKSLKAQVSNLRAEVDTKSTALNKLHADKSAIAKQLVVLRTRVTKLTAEQVAKEVNAGDSFHLTKRVKELEAQLAQFNKAEKPPDSAGSEFERWKEKKRLQQQAESLKKKLKQVEEQDEEHKDKILNLRSLVQRIEAEKRVLEDRVKVKSEREIRTEAVEEDNIRLRAQITVVEQQLEDLKEDRTSTDRHRLQIKVLEGRIRKQEKKIADLELSPSPKRQTTFVGGKNKKPLNSEYLGMKIVSDQVKLITPKVKD